MTSEHDRDRAAAELDALVLGLDDRADRISQRVPMTSVSYRTTMPRTNGALAKRSRGSRESSGSRRADDLAVGVAQGDADRVAAAHQHAFDQGLAAVGEVGHAA